MQSLNIIRRTEEQEDRRCCHLTGVGLPGESIGNQSARTHDYLGVRLSVCLSVWTTQENHNGVESDRSHARNARSHRMIDIAKRAVLS